MPLVERSIEPHYVSRVVVGPGIRNELEFFSNATLCHVIRQLSSLSKHAEDLFSDLHRETSSIFYRECKLLERVDRLKTKIQQLNPVKDSVSLQDMNQRKPFKSSVTKEQQILSFSTRPLAITDKYNECEPPPPLHKLDSYREDGKDSLKFYTDPEYFIELWCQQIMKESDNQHKKQRRNKRTRIVKEARTIRAPKTHQDEYKERRHGPEFIGSSIAKDQHYHGIIPTDSQGYVRPSSLEVSTLPSPASQRGIVGHGMSPAEYGLLFGSLRGSLTDSSPALAYTSGHGVDANESKPYANTDHGVTNHYAGDSSQSNRSTPSKQVKTSASDQMRRLIESPYSYGDRYTPGDGKSSASRDVASPRPTMPPPAPPPDANEQRRGNTPAMRSLSIMNRDQLPPPPPAPTQQVARSESSASRSGRHAYSPTGRDYGQLEPGPVATSPKGKHNNSFDLPPPPSPPPMNNHEQIPSPPPVPPPPVDDLKDHGGGYAMSPPAPPLPPPLDLQRLPLHKDMRNMPDWENDLAATDTVSLASDTSSATLSSKTEEQAKLEKPAVRDTRSDLLSAIRTGFQLRKVEERRLKTEQKQNTAVRLDVQAIMEAAFERRRKALEENDSDKDDDDDAEDNWSDDG